MGVPKQKWPRDSLMARPNLMSTSSTLVILVLMNQVTTGVENPSTDPLPSPSPVPSPSPAPSPSPSFMQCGYKHFWANDHKFITYDRLITDHSNGEYLNSFDVEAGTFTAGTAGLYSVHFSSSVPYNTLNDYIEVSL